MIIKSCVIEDIFINRTNKNANLFAFVFLLVGHLDIKLSFPDVFYS